MRGNHITDIKYETAGYVALPQLRVSDHQLLVSETPLLRQTMRRDDRKETSVIDGIIVRRLGGDEPMYSIQKGEWNLSQIYLTEAEAFMLVGMLAKFGITAGGER